MKKLIFAVFGLFITFSQVNAAWALVQYDQIYTVGAQGSEDAKDTFGWNEKPWVFLQFPTGTHQYDSEEMFSEWSLGPEDNFYFDSSEDIFYKSGNKAWVAFSDTNWNAIKQHGEWEISSLTVFYKDGDPKKTAIGSTTFTVSPEPVSSSLFLLGAGGIFARRLRRKSIA